MILVMIRMKEEDNDYDDRIQSDVDDDNDGSDDDDDDDDNNNNDVIMMNMRMIMMTYYLSLEKVPGVSRMLENKFTYRRRTSLSYLHHFIITYHHHHHHHHHHHALTSVCSTKS